MGNGGPDSSTLQAPADSPGAISIGSVYKDGDIAYTSSRGPTSDGRIKPDLVAVGSGVWVVSPTSLDGYVVQSGTSFATPTAAGIGALLLQAYPNLSPTTMAELLRESAAVADKPNNDVGWGLVNASAAAYDFCAPPPPL